MFFYSLLRSGASLPEIILCALAMIIAACVSIILHEIAHGYAALACGDRTAKDRGRLTLNPVAHFDLMGLLLMLVAGFGWAKPVPIDPRNFKNRKKGMIIVSSAGVVTNLVLAGLGLLILYLSIPVIGFYTLTTKAAIIYLRMFVYYLLVFFISINFMLAFFNLIPVYPLDGFRLLNEFLPRGNKYSAFMYKYGMWVLIAIIIIGNLFDLMGTSLGNSVLQYFDIFGLVSRLIQKLISLVIGV